MSSPLVYFDPITMENMQSVRHVPILRGVAKKVATNRRALNSKHRRLQQLVQEEFDTEIANFSNLVGVAPLTPKKTPSIAADGVTASLINPMQDLPLFPEAHPKHDTHGDITIGTMDRVARDLYKLAAVDFETMDVYAHMKYILTDMKEKGQLTTEVLDTIVTRDLVLAALHRKDSAKRDFGAFIAKEAGLSNLPKTLDPLFKACENCGDKFNFPRHPHNHRGRSPKHVYKGECRYHPGALRCYNDELFRQGEPLKEKFLTHGQVKMSEFQCMIHICHWDCCGAKLVALSPDVGERSRKHRNVPLQVWEIRNEGDGGVGCKASKYHVEGDRFCIAYN
ncbi:hypothetical protein GGR53DRAFT_525704 [Hypoxylon sp. FL1150]|nr:hypothetical protein GGR53DRAFT_525704 [Hypoxylon sp. FL1150]